jgi:hypothetical protein
LVRVITQTLYGGARQDGLDGCQRLQALREVLCKIADQRREQLVDVRVVRVEGRPGNVCSLNDPLDGDCAVPDLEHQRHKGLANRATGPAHSPVGRISQTMLSHCEQSYTVAVIIRRLH